MALAVSGRQSPAIARCQTSNRHLPQEGRSMRETVVVLTDDIDKTTKTAWRPLPSPSTDRREIELGKVNAGSFGRSTSR